MSDDTTSLNCKTCGKEITGNYCTHCGEQRVTKRIGLKSFTADLLSDMVSLEAPVLYTIKQLIVGPGKVAQRYISGNRKVFSKPFAFFFLMLAIHYVLSSWILDPVEVTKMIADSLSESMADMPDFTAEQMEQFVSFFESFQKNSKEFNFLNLPFMAFFSWLFFRKSGYNFLENVVLFLYVNGINIFFSIINLLLCLISLKVLISFGGIIGLITIIYLTWATVQFHNQKTFWGVIKAIGVYFVSSITMALILPLIYGIFMT